MNHDLLFIVKNIRKALPHTLIGLCMSVSCKSIQCGHCLIAKYKDAPFRYIETIEVVIEQ